MQKLVYTVGLPGSGKSTWARQLIDSEPGKWKRVNKDELRKMLDNSHWSKANEKMVVRVRDSIIHDALYHGYNVVSDDTNFDSSHKVRFQEFADLYCVTLEVKDFTDVPLEECIKRDLQRFDSVGEKVIRGMYNKYLKDIPVSPEYNSNLPDAIICDLDGTLCLLNGRNPYDASTCENDLPNDPVVQILKSLKETTKYVFIFVSGRDQKDLGHTMSWINNNLPFLDGHYGLHMRPRGDTRKDSIIKEEIYHSFIENRYNVKLVMDDRNQTVKVWRTLGLPTFQVSEGDF